MDGISPLPLLHISTVYCFIFVPQGPSESDAGPLLVRRDANEGIDKPEGGRAGELASE